jgi:hypothetical protein
VERCFSWEGFPRPQKWFATGEAIARSLYLQRKGVIVRMDEEAMTTFSLNGLRQKEGKVGWRTTRDGVMQCNLNSLENLSGFAV